MTDVQKPLSRQEVQTPDRRQQMLDIKTQCRRGQLAEAARQIGVRAPVSVLMM